MTQELETYLEATKRLQDIRYSEQDKIVQARLDYVKANPDASEEEVKSAAYLLYVNSNPEIVSEGRELTTLLEQLTTEYQYFVVDSYKNTRPLFNWNPDDRRDG